MKQTSNRIDQAKYLVKTIQLAAETLLYSGKIEALAEIHDFAMRICSNSGIFESPKIGEEVAK